MNKHADLSVLNGLVITSIDSGVNGTWNQKTGTLIPFPLKFPTDGDEEIRFHTSCGRTFRMYHQQDCCEDVAIEEIIGDLRDLLNTTMVSATVEEGECNSNEYGDEQWTFYTLRTHKGTVTLRWHGSSNGYYSTSVDFVEVIPDNAGTAS